MGTYTNPYLLYKPNGGDVVDVETQLNRNLDIIDTKSKLIYDYYGTDIQSITTSDLDKSIFAKYYKTHSNSVVYIKTDNLPLMDSRGYNPEWEDFAFLNGWNAAPGYDSPVGFSREMDESLNIKYIRMSGNIRLNTYDNIVPGTSYTVGNIPSGRRPATSRVYRANSDTNLSIADLVVNTAGNVIVTRFGNAQTNGAASNIISLHGVGWAV